jgi:hypothetical protein
MALKDHSDGCNEGTCWTGEYKAALSIDPIVFDHFYVDETSPSGIRWKKPSTSASSKPGLNATKPDNVAGCLNNTGYWRVELKGRQYQTHRIVVFLVTGIDPMGYQIDHEDGNRSNNNIKNLVKKSGNENNKNKKRRKTNTSGRTGVYWISDSSKWRVNITVSGERIELGRYSDFDEAVRKRKEAETKYFFHENHDRNANG